MSRNFELLNQAGRLQDMLEAPVLTAEPKIPVEVPLAGPDPSSSPALDVGGPVREEIAKLVLNLFVMPGAQSVRQVAFAAVEPGSGCSWMCARIGEILAAQTNASVCLVDCNLRAPTLHRQFQTENHYGLSDSLLQTNSVRQYVQQLSRRNLWLLSCGSEIENWQEKIASEKLELRLKELRAQFDYVLLDVAPMNNYNDAIVLGRVSQGVVLVLKANSTRRETAQKALQQFKTAGIPVLGAVLNQRTFPIPGKIYNWL